MENIVNMTKCVKGSTVHFRCGGDAFVKTTDPKDFRGFRLSFLHDGVDFDLFYHMEGQCVGGTHMTFLDIIRIDPPAFDWSDVMVGMAFEYRGEIFWFASHSWVTNDNWKTIQPHSNGAYFLPYQNFCNRPEWRSFEGLARAPEHDIEIKQ